MNGLFVVQQRYDINDLDGVEKKIVSQIKVFNEYGLNCEPYFIEDKTEINFWKKVLARLPFTNVNPHWKYDKRFASVDYIYFRRPYIMNLAMRRFIRKIKKNNPRLKIVMELPTYPYDGEYGHGIGGQFFKIKDKYNRKKLSGLVDRIAIAGNTESIEKLWDIPVINFINGIDMDNIFTKNVFDSNIINILCVAIFRPWHGYERLLTGLAKYYNVDNGKREIIVHMVGEGTDLDLYNDIVCNEQIAEHVHFYGRLVGEELNTIYSKADIAVASLGLYKIGLSSCSFLKTGEYLAHGLPMIIGSDIPLIEREDFSYCYKFPNDGSPIDFNKVVEFYDEVYYSGKSRQSISNEIYRFALDNLDIKVAMRPIVNYLLK